MKHWFQPKIYFLILSIISCINNKTDNKIVQMENLLSKWEKKKQSGNLNFNDYISIQQEIIQLDSNATILKQESHLTKTQIEKSKEISLRLEKLITIK